MCYVWFRAILSSTFAGFRVDWSMQAMAFGRRHSHSPSNRLIDGKDPVVLRVSARVSEIHSDTNCTLSIMAYTIPLPGPN